MGEEASGLPERPDLKPPQESKGHVYSILKKLPGAESVFSRFVQRISLIFIRVPQKEEFNLSGRITELQTLADTVLLELLDFKKALSEKIDPDLYAMVATILDPLIKETGHVPPAIETKNNTAQQVKVFSRYVDSIEKAKMWVEIGTLHKSKDKLEQALIHQAAKEFLCRIDRDIQVIQDYLNHAFCTFEISDVLKNDLKDKLMPELDPKILELYQLKNLPADLSMESFIQWRASSDQHRQVLFGAALHIIDHFCDEFLPCPQKEKESGHLRAIVEQLTGLEENIKKINGELENARHLDDAQRQSYIARIEKLEDEAHQLNCNLRLSHEHGERLESCFESLLSLREDLMY